jgi:hypothetical protein
MAWERRKRGGLYYTRSKKIGGRVIREYVGSGPLAELAVLMDEEDRLRREEEAEAWRDDRERLEALEAPIAELCEITETLAQAALLAAGYHQHKRGEWRKRRVSSTQKQPMAKSVATKHSAKDGQSETPTKDILAVLERAQEGDRSALPELKTFIHRVPKDVRVINLAKMAEESLLTSSVGKDLMTKELMSRELETMRQEIAGPSPTPLERLLVERVVACWHQLQDAEIIYHQNRKKLTIRQSEYHQRRLDRLHRRYLSAIRTLVQVRKLLKPGVPQVAQINIAEQQINTAGGV